MSAFRIIQKRIKVQELNSLELQLGCVIQTIHVLRRNYMTFILPFLLFLSQILDIYYSMQVKSQIFQLLCFFFIIITAIFSNYVMVQAAKNKIKKTAARRIFLSVLGLKQIKLEKWYNQPKFYLAMIVCSLMNWTKFIYIVDSYQLRKKGKVKNFAYYRREKMALEDKTR